MATVFSYQLFLATLAFLGVCWGYPIADEETTDEEVRQLQNYRQDPTGGVLGAIGTALVPVVGAILGPILTNLANGISTAFNNGLNNQGTTTTTTASPSTSTTTRPPRDQFGFGISPLEGQPGFVVRVPGQESPFYLLPHAPSVESDGLPSVGPDSAAGGKLSPSQDGAEEDDTVSIVAADSLHSEPIKLDATHLKKLPLRPLTETEYH